MFNGLESVKSVSDVLAAHLKDDVIHDVIPLT